MIPSTKAIEQAFNIFNQRYFGNKIPKPKFSISPLKGMWGYFDPNRMEVDGGKVIRYGTPCGTLYLNNTVSRDKMSILNTLLHEMVHMYTFLVLREYPRDPHKGTFMFFANKLNADGWDIREKNEWLEGDALAREGEQQFDDWNDLNNGALDNVAFLYQRIIRLKNAMLAYKQKKLQEMQQGQQ